MSREAIWAITSPLWAWPNPAKQTSQHGWKLPMLNRNIIHVDWPAYTARKPLLWSRPKRSKKVHLKMQLHLSVLEPLEKVEVPKYQVVDKLGLGWRLLACCWKGVYYIGNGWEQTWMKTPSTRTVQDRVYLGLSENRMSQKFDGLSSCPLSQLRQREVLPIFGHMLDKPIASYSLSFTGELRTLND